MLTGGVGCASTDNNMGRLSETRELRDDDDELNTGGVSLFLFFYWLVATRSFNASPRSYTASF